jgi:hypothetical protein
MVPPRIGCLCGLFEDDVIPAFELQMITNRKTSLSTSDDYGVKFPEFFHDVTSLAYSLSFVRSEANDAVVLQLPISRKLLLEAPKNITIHLALPRVRFYLFTFQLIWKLLRRWCDHLQGGFVAIRKSGRGEV